MRHNNASLLPIFCTVICGLMLAVVLSAYGWSPTKTDICEHHGSEAIRSAETAGISSQPRRLSGITNANTDWLVSALASAVATSMPRGLELVRTPTPETVNCFPNVTGFRLTSQPAATSTAATWSANAALSKVTELANTAALWRFTLFGIAASRSISDVMAYRDVSVSVLGLRRSCTSSNCRSAFAVTALARANSVSITIIRAASRSILAKSRLATMRLATSAPPPARKVTPAAITAMAWKTEFQESAFIECAFFVVVAAVSLLVFLSSIVIAAFLWRNRR
jgi:hypothetical protein